MDKFGAHLHRPGRQAAELSHAAAQFVAGLEEQDGFGRRGGGRGRSERPGGGKPGDAAPDDGDGDELRSVLGRTRRALGTPAIADEISDPSRVT